MAYLALARKYRPSKFEEVIGQITSFGTLSNAIRLERVHHAFSFTGARGVGKTTMARALARALLNQKRERHQIPVANVRSVTRLRQGPVLMFSKLMARPTQVWTAYVTSEIMCDFCRRRHALKFTSSTKSTCSRPPLLMRCSRRSRSHRRM